MVCALEARGHQADKAGLQAEESIVIFGGSPGGQPLPQLWEEDGIEGMGMIPFGGKAFIKMKRRKQLPRRQAEIITVPRGLRRIEQMGYLQFKKMVGVHVFLLYMLLCVQEDFLYFFRLEGLD